jgi:hypothetical protein
VPLLRFVPEGAGLRLVAEGDPDGEGRIMEEDELLRELL